MGTVHLWQQARALLFIPATAHHLVAKACASGAQALILDLEDAVSAQDKPSARASLAALVKKSHAAGLATLVRVNHDLLMLADDLRCLVNAGADGFVLPKAGSPDVWSLIDQALHDLQAPHLPALALLEHPQAFATNHAMALAQVPRVHALALGSEDFAASVGAPPSRTLLMPVAQQLVLAAKSRDKAAFAIPASIAHLHDMAEWEQAAIQARAWGADGGLCIHPKQLAVLNRVFAPTAEERLWAQTVVAASEKHPAQGVFRINGQMIDAPVVRRAQRILGQIFHH